MHTFLLRIKFSAVLLSAVVLGLLNLQTASAQSALTPSVVAMVGPNVDLTLSDSFDSGQLSPDWSVWSDPPQLTAGQLALVGHRSWQTAITRSYVGVDKGVLELFQYSAGELEFFLDSGSYDAPAYRNMHLTTYSNDFWEAYATFGVHGQNIRNYTKTKLIPGKWYYLLVRIAADKHFYFQIWEKDATGHYLMNVEIIPPGDGWDGPWLFGNKVFLGTLTLAEYAELRFPPDYERLCSVTPRSSAVVRKGPGTQYDLAGQLIWDSESLVRGQALDSYGSPWWRLDDFTWVRADLVKSQGNCAMLPTVTP